MAFGQKIHEIKTDVLLPLVVNGAHLAYEFIPEKRLGVELEARYRWNVNGHYSNEGPISAPCPSIECEYPLFIRQQKVLTININAKFYLMKKRSGSGPYAGAYVREDWLLSRRDRGYEYLYIPEYYLSGQSQPVQNRNLRNSIGLLAGYKFLLWKHWTLEASMGLDWDYPSLFGDRSNDVDPSGIPSLKAGYRL